MKRMESTIEERQIGEASEDMPCLMARERLTVHELWIKFQLLSDKMSDK